MNTNMIITQSVTESRMMLRRREVVFFSVLLPTMFMLLFGGIYGSVKDENGISVINYLLPGYMVMAVMSVSFISLGVMTANERQYGILKRLGATPLPRAVLLTGKMAAIALVVTGAVVVLLALGLGFYGVRIIGGPLDIAAIVLLGVLVFATIGLMIGGMVKPEAAPAILNAAYFPMLFLGGALIPLTQMPDWLQQVGKLLPSYHFSNALIEVMVLGHSLPDVWPNLAAMAAWGAGAILVASRTFKWE
jgi:ABC-2 type transport system permease protein